MDDLSKTMAEKSAAPKKAAGSARWKPAALTAAVPLGLLLVLWFVFRDQLARAIPVETARVVLLEQDDRTVSDAQPGPVEMLFQASGWVEPDPWPINVAVKTDGFVEQVFVKEGEPVKKHQRLATLDPQDAELALAEAESRLIASEKKLAATAARLGAKRDTWERIAQTGPQAISLNDREKAKQEFLEAQAEEQAGAAAVNVTKVIRDAARLALERTTIRSPLDGIVLHRHAEPGDKRRVGADDPTSAMIISLYDPANLQVRVDVPIAEAGKMIDGQPCKISTAMLPGRTFSGEVTRIIGQADLQRNTLQAKVRIDEPDERLRPDVLCRVEFWKTATGGASGSSGNHTLWIPETALPSDDLEQTVWVVDPLTQTVQQRAIRLTTAVRDGLRQAADGLRANELIVLKSEAALSEGARVKEVSP